MVEKKEGYIQFPTLPEDLDGNMVRLLWEYAKLPETDREAIYKQYQILSKLERTREEVDKANLYKIAPENIEKFLQCIQLITSQLFHEAMSLARYVFEECFVKGNDVEDIMPGDPRKQEAILAMYMLFLDDENGDLGMPS